MPHRLDFYSPDGTFLDSVEKWIQLDYALVENEIGGFSATLPGELPWGLTSIENRVAIYRTAPNGSTRLVGNQLWFIRRRSKSERSNHAVQYNIVGFDSKTLLKRKIVANHSASIYSYVKNKAIDDAMKFIVRYQLGNLCPDTTRIVPGLTVAADLAQAPLTSHNFAFEEVFDYLQTLQKEAFEGGTYLVFDILCTDVKTPQFLFQVFISQRGSDHRVGSSKPLIASPSRGTLINGEWTDDHTEEGNYVYAGGQTEGVTRVITTASDPAAIALSPFNRCETFYNASSEEFLFQVVNSAKAELKSKAARHTISGEIQSRPKFLYDVDWTYGDLLTGEIAGESGDLRVSKVYVSCSQKKETINASSEGSGGRIFGGLDPVTMQLISRTKRLEAALKRVNTRDNTKTYGYALDSWASLPGMRCLWDMNWNVDGTSERLRSKPVLHTAFPVGGIYNTVVPYLVLNGTTQYASRATEDTFNYSYFMGGGFTLGGWVRPHTFGVANAILTKWRETGSNNRGYAIQLVGATGLLHFVVSVDGTSAKSFVSGLTSTANVWQFVVARFTASSEMKVWMNRDAETLSTAIPASVFDCAANFGMGVTDPGGTPTSFFDGDIGACFLSALPMSDEVVNFMYCQTAQFYGH